LQRDSYDAEFVDVFATPAHLEHEHLLYRQQKGADLLEMREGRSQTESITLGGATYFCTLAKITHCRHYAATPGFEIADAYESSFGSARLLSSILADLTARRRWVLSKAKVDNAVVECFTQRYTRSSEQACFNRYGSLAYFNAAGESLTLESFKLVSLKRGIALP
jgi:hypothetical protein